MSVNRKTNSGLQKLAGLYNALTARLSDLLDVNITTPTNGQAMLYNSTTQKWENQDISSGSAIKWEEANTSVKKNLINLDLNYIKTINTAGTWSGNVYTFNDITFTFNSDSTITINGTASNDTKFHLIPVATGWFLDYDTDYIMSGCPTNGGRSSYYMRINSNYRLYEDSGNGVDINIASEQSSKVFGLQILIASGYAATNVIFKPMIRLASVEDDTYVPYIPDNVELDSKKADVSSLATVATSGSYNDLSNKPTIDYYLDQTATTSTTDPTTYTFTDAKITANSAIDPYADIFGVSPSSVVASAGTCTVTFPKQDTAQSMTCRIYIK